MILPKLIRGLQPLGFLLLLLYFIIPYKPVSIPLFWAGTALSLAGAAVEVRQFIKLSAKRKSGKQVLFWAGIVVKCLLIASIAIRIYDVKYSVFILLFSIVLAVIWSIISAFYKPVSQENEILDDPGI